VTERGSAYGTQTLADFSTDSNAFTRALPTGSRISGPVISGLSAGV
jgi:hypothetical protein